MAENGTVENGPYVAPRVGDEVGVVGVVGAVGAGVVVGAVVVVLGAAVVRTGVGELVVLTGALVVIVGLACLGRAVVARLWSVA